MSTPPGDPWSSPPPREIPLRLTDLVAVLDAMPLATLVVREDGAIAEVNRLATEVFGATREELLGVAVEALLPEAARAAHAAQRAGFATSGRARPMGAMQEISGRRRDGSLFPAEVGLGALRTPDGSFTLATVADRSAQRVAETEARRVREQLETALQAAQAYTFCIDFETRRVHYDAHTAALYKVPPERLEGVTLEQIGHFSHADDVPHIRAALRDVMAGDAAEVSLVHRLVRGDGAVRTFSTRGRVERDDAGRALRVNGVGVDVTAEQAALDALRGSELRFRQLAENIREVFWLTTPDHGTVEYVSPAFEAVWGRTPAELLASPSLWFDAVHPDDRAAVRAALDASVDGSYTATYRVVRPDGGVRWVRDHGFPVRDATGALVRVAGTAEDITERRQLEAQLLQTQKMESIGLLAGGIAHDFNNWLTVISSNCELLLDALLEQAPEHGLVGEVRDAASRASTLTRQLLAFSRQQVVEPRVLDVGALIADTEKLLRRMIGEDITLRTRVSPTLRRVRMDPGLLTQVLMNLAVNARDAMPRGGELLLAAEDTARGDRGPFVRITVADTGEGMSAAVRARIFEPFFTTKGVGRGTGLGLAVVHGIVSQSGGFIEVESAPGAGARFDVLLPAAAADARDTRARRASPRPGGGGETVLVVEDEDIVRRVLMRLLRLHGYRVLDAGNGHEALTLLAAHGGDVQLVITDVVMPGLDGRELAAEVQRQRPGVKVLYASGYTDDAIVRHGVRVAEVSFLQKPYTPSTLLQKVREVLDGP